MQLQLFFCDLDFMDFACGVKVTLGSPCVYLTTVLSRLLVLDRVGGFSCYLVMSLA